MKKTYLRGRYFRILIFFAGVIVRFIYWELILRKIGFRQLARSTRPDRFLRDAQRFRALALHMGGVMIKVGQFLSSRLDILPPEITDTLADLQDEVPAETFADIRQLAERELGAPLSQKFEWFDERPLAAASLGQVHRARLKADENLGFVNVVVKVQRPHIAAIVEMDLSALRRVGKWLMYYRPIREHADAPALLREFSATVYEEIDYYHEADNAETFFKNFKDDKKVNVPRVARSLSTLRVLTLEDVFAIKITDYDAIAAAGIDRGEVARKLLDVYLKQIFEHGFFHADPHPGNLFVTPLPSAKGGKRKSVRWQLTFVDFGMVGQISEDTRAGLRQLAIAVGTRDASRLMEAYKALGFILTGSNTEALEQAASVVFDRFWGMPVSELKNMRPSDAHEIGHRVRDALVDVPFQVPNNLMLLLRTFAILSGMCTGLDADFNVWKQIAPYARKLVEEEAADSFELESVLQRVGEAAQALIALPGQASHLMLQMESGRLTVQSPQVSREVRALVRSVDKLTGGVVFAALLVSGVMSVNSGNGQLGAGLLAVAGATLLWVLFGGRGRK
ncbi:MAG: AarF/ABC1/UbiB kinase family protein [Chloroflexi bacterium]|nr:AarF/ABC1/UbiB kinase family protein [Chloroflexota bacterium]